MDTITQIFTQLFMRFPTLAGLFGLGVTGLFGVLGWSSWQNLQKFGDEPTPIALAAASETISAERQWVTVADAKWDCASVVPFGVGSDTRVEAIFTDETGTILVVALLSKAVPCAELMASPPTGEIYRMSEGRQAYLLRQGRFAKHPKATAYLELCAFCGPANSQMGVILGLIFGPLGLGLYPLVLYFRQRALKQSSGLPERSSGPTRVSSWQAALRALSSRGRRG